MKKSFISVFIIFFFLVSLISLGQSIDFDKEKSFFSENIDNYGREEVAKYGCQLYVGDEVDEDADEVDTSFGGISALKNSSFRYSKEFTKPLYYRGFPFTGRVFSNYNSGSRKWEQTYYEGWRSGDFITYFESGKINSRGKYKENKLEGVFYIYCENGGMEKITYQNDKKNGVWEGFYPNGKLFFKGHYVNDKLNKKEEFYNDPRIGKIYELY
jgi:antitoxin component YwqK of YwqJK toxin-antitoxin module